MKVNGPPCERLLAVRALGSVLLLSSEHSLSCQETVGCKVMKRTSSWMDCLRCHHATSDSFNAARKMRNMVCGQNWRSRPAWAGDGGSCAGRSLALEMLSCWVRKVCTLWETGHEFAFHRLKTRRWSPCRNGMSTHEVLMLVNFGTPALIVVSVNGRTWFFDSFACNYEDHPATLR